MASRFHQQEEFSSFFQCLSVAAGKHNICPPPTPQFLFFSFSEKTESPQMEEDWQNLFDFSIEDNVFLSLDSEFQQPSSTVLNPVVSEPANPNSDDSLDRVRKRDPRLTCENFLAGRIPCSCPELDDKEEEEEEGAGRKRARTTAARCQVPGCEADISELKGYHKRHRVCLRCANAATVVLDGQIKRYCQQCGKFHILPDFDEGKRSCRRKLERHNRRRRKPVESRRGVEGLQGNMLSEDVACDGEAGKDIFNGVSGGTDRFCLSNPITDTETLLELESGHGSPFDSAAGQKNLGGQNIQCNSILSSVASGEPQIDGSVDNSRSALSSSLSGKNVYSSVCPTGRMSFKLYDWNPAEFPRRLRHQIFQWLASMPVELEGYIRPGCTILTVFIAMPRFMWDKFLGDAAAFLDDLVSAPGSLLSGRGNMLIYLDNAVFQVLKDGNSLIKSKIEMQVPRLHYVHPICFEAGKPMEFIACGSYLSQPKFRFLVSFAGKYLKYDYCLPIPCLKAIPCNEIKGDSDHSSDHQTFKIFIPPMETEIFGPAFIEVENESGISNFIPVLFGDGQICYELQMIQEKIGEFFHSKSNISQFMAIGAVSDSCGVFVLIQAAMSELILDIGWLLKEPQLEKEKTHLTSMQIQRLNSLLYFLIESGSVSILEKILQSLKNGMHLEEFCGPLKNINDVDLKLFKKYLSHAKEIIYQKLQSTVDSRTVLHSEATQGGAIPATDFETDKLYTMRSNKQDMEMSKEDAVCFELTVKLNWAQERDEKTLLLKEESIMEVNHSPRLVKRLAVPRKACLHLYPRMIPRRRFFVLVIASVAACCGLCLVFLHPDRMGEFANSVRRCLFGNPKA